MADQNLIKISPAGASIYGFTHAPADSLLNCGYALLTIAGADRDTINAIREVICVKNDTTMFLRPEHPRNDRAGFLAVRYVGSTISD